MVESIFHYGAPPCRGFFIWGPRQDQSSDVQCKAEALSEVPEPDAKEKEMMEMEQNASWPHGQIGQIG